MLISDNVENWIKLKENTVARQSGELPSDWVREDFSEYVAHLQLHMALQARNLVPNLAQGFAGGSSGDSRAQAQSVVGSREQLLHQTQATIEMLVSRQ